MELFANPFVFVYMAAVAAVIAALWYFGGLSRKNALKRLFSADNYDKLAPAGLARRRMAADTLFLCALALLFAALAAPQWGRGEITAQAQYSQAVAAVDVSASMLAQDIKPDRLESAKTMLAMLLENMRNERLGLIAFTSQAWLQCPITTDTAALKTLAGALSTQMLPAPGTALAPAVKLADKMLGPYAGKKALILITDGEDHNPQDIRAALKEARENEIRIITVGVGSAEGELIPVISQNGEKTYKKDSEGKTVLTKLDERALFSLARETGGIYIKYNTPQQTADDIAAQLAALDRTLTQSNARAVYKNRYQLPLCAAIILLLASVLIPLKKCKIR
ncbi:MAG: VWA domain-containing protein [Elusimicrobiota bacterium]|jgi:Ca-activated chloride channel family protein|nr:VWA domain-containing protein [Elusimicrobiota bacterium]